MMRRHKLNSAGESFADLPLVPNLPPPPILLTSHNHHEFYEDHQVLLENTET